MLLTALDICLCKQHPKIELTIKGCGMLPFVIFPKWSPKVLRNFKITHDVKYFLVGILHRSCQLPRISRELLHASTPDAFTLK